MEIALYGRALRQRWLVIVVFLILGLACASAWSLTRAATYTAAAEAYVSTAVADNVNDLTQGGTFAEQAVVGYAELATSPYVLTPVITELGLEFSEAQLQEMVTVETPESTSVLRIVVESDSPNRSADIANAVMTELTAAVEKVTPLTSSDVGYVRVTPIAPAIAPSTPSSPRFLTVLAIGGAAGLALGLLVALVRELSDRTIRDPNQLIDSGRSTLTVIPGALPDSANARREAYRILAMKLGELGDGARSRSIVVTSPGPSETSSDVSRDLAFTLAESGARVLLVDTDMPRARLTESVLGARSSAGLGEALTGTMGIERLVTPLKASTVDFLSAGNASASRIVTSLSAATTMLFDASHPYTWVIMDAPPVLDTADTVQLSRLATGTLIVVDLGRSKIYDVQSAQRLLGDVGAAFCGLVVTGGSRRRRPRAVMRSRAEGTPIDQPSSTPAAVGGGSA